MNLRFSILRFSRRALIAFASVAIMLLCSSGRADVLYCETFGIPPTGVSADLYATNFNWQRFDANGAEITTGGSSAGVNFSAVGRLVNVTNVNAGPDSDGTFNAYTNGILYFGATPSPSLGLTTEYSFDPNNYVAGSIVFSWYEGNALTAQSFRVIVRIGGKWYASTTSYTSAAVALTSFGTSSELKTFTYNPAAANWQMLNFNGDYIVGPTPGTGTTVNSSAGAMTLGAAPAADLSGTITGFGIYGDNGGTGTGNRRIDTFTISGTPNGTPPPTVVAFNQAVSMAINVPVNVSLGATNTSGAPLAFFIAGNPANGTLGVLNSNLVTYTPNSSYTGSDAFTFYASDSSATSAVATVSMTVTNTVVPYVYPSGPEVKKDGTAVLLENVARAPMSSRTLGVYPPVPDFSGQMARINFMRAEPTNAPSFGSRYFICDQDRNLYIVDKADMFSTNGWKKYINFEEVFPRFDNDPGFAGGMNTFQFDSGYATNGIFYTVHMETTTSPTLGPTNGALPGFNTNGYTTTAAINPPVGSVARIAVLVEWTDTNIANTTFEGTAREIMRVGFSSNIHPMGDLLFNPLALPGDSDYHNLYIANGDGGAGESTGTHTIPQRLDALQGKILRITPDLNLRPGDELSGNGRYRIPTTGTDPNPFVSNNGVFTNLTGVRKEIFAFGFRNCHRISWDVFSNKIIEDDIGLHSWEEVNIIHKGTDYGYAEREGTEQLFVSSNGAINGKTGGQIGSNFPASDLLTVTGLVAQVTPNYPVANYSHRDGDAVSSGFVYRGKLMPQLYGKYIFGDITTGRIFYSDLGEMIATDDGIRTNPAAVHEIQVVFDSPYDTTNYPVQRRMFNIISEEYHQRGGTSSALPGGATVTGGSDPDGVPYGGGRADIRFALGDDNEIYILSKSDGMIRKMMTVLAPPVLQTSAMSNGQFNLTWPTIPNRTYRIQFKNSLTSTNWTDLTGNLTTTNLTFTLTNAPATNMMFYRVSLLP